MCMQGDLNLNICEAHAFNTLDKFSLDVFVVNGWKGEVRHKPFCTHIPSASEFRKPYTIPTFSQYNQSCCIRPTSQSSACDTAHLFRT